MTLKKCTMTRVERRRAKLKRKIKARAASREAYAKRLKEQAENDRKCIELGLISIPIPWPPPGCRAMASLGVEDRDVDNDRG